MKESKPKLLHLHGMGRHMTHNGGMEPHNTKSKEWILTSYKPSSMPKTIKWHGILKQYKAK